MEWDGEGDANPGHIDEFGIELDVVFDMQITFVVHRVGNGMANVTGFAAATTIIGKADFGADLFDIVEGELDFVDSQRAPIA